MKVVRKNDKRIDFEGAVSTRRGNGGSQRIDVFDKQRPLPIEQIDREEPAPPGTNARR